MSPKTGVSIRKWESDEAREVLLKELYQSLSEYEAAELIKRQVVHDMSNALHILGLYLDTFAADNGMEKTEIDFFLSNMHRTIMRLYPRDEQKKEVDLYLLSRHFILFMQRSYLEFSINFVSDLENALVSLTENQLFIILLNLLSNASQAMEKTTEKKISLRLFACQREGKNYYCLSLMDTGGGIPLEYHLKIFQPYFSTKKTGKGLGLSMVKEIMDEIGGVIDLETEINIGTTFILYFPVKE